MNKADRIKKDRITREYLKECLDYCPNSGVFTWKARPRYHFRDKAAESRVNGRMAGKSAGAYSESEKFTYIIIDGKKFRAARLAVIHRIGQIGKRDIICVNGNGKDLRIINLKVVAANSGRTTRTWAHGASGHTGITMRGSKYEARLHLDGKVKYLGSSETIEAAIRLRKAAEQEYGIRQQKRSA